MSTNSECHFIEPQPGRWYYFIEGPFAPKDTWDWREHAVSHGPFVSKDEAKRHLGSNYANPGGWNSYPFGYYKMDATAEKLIADATI